MLEAPHTGVSHGKIPLNLWTVMAVLNCIKTLTKTREKLYISMINKAEHPTLPVEAFKIKARPAVHND